MTTKSRTGLEEELQKVFHFNQVDLEANRGGKLSETQLERWKKVRKRSNRMIKNPDQPVIPTFEELPFRDKLPILIVIFLVILVTLILCMGEVPIVWLVRHPLALIISTTLIGLFILELLRQGQRNNISYVVSLLSGNFSQQRLLSTQGKLTFKESQRELSVMVNQIKFLLKREQYDYLKNLYATEPRQPFIFYYLQYGKVILSIEPTSMDKSYWFER